jgi:hypothetical protein
MRGDQNRLTAALTHLVKNAVAFTSQGGVTCRVRRAGDELAVDVGGTGRGIAPEDQEAIFETFRQLGDHLTDKPGGTGLGLAIARAVAGATAAGSRCKAPRAGAASSPCSCRPRPPLPGNLTNRAKRRNSPGHIVKPFPESFYDLRLEQTAHRQVRRRSPDPEEKTPDATRGRHPPRSRTPGRPFVPVPLLAHRGGRQGGHGLPLPGPDPADRQRLRGGRPQGLPGHQGHGPADLDRGSRRAARPSGATWWPGSKTRTWPPPWSAPRRNWRPPGTASPRPKPR